MRVSITSTGVKVPWWVWSGFAGLIVIFALLLVLHWQDRDIFMAIGTWLGALGVILGLGFAYFQLRDFRRSTDFDAYTRLLEPFGTEKWANADARLFSSEPFLHMQMKVSELDETGNAALVVLDVYERIGQLVRFGLVDEDLILEAVFYNVLRVWNRLTPFIEFHQKQGALYFRNAVYLHDRAEEYRKRQGAKEPRTPTLDDFKELIEKAEKKVPT
jgi:hypothetical protein